MIDEIGRVSSGLEEIKENSEDQDNYSDGSFKGFKEDNFKTSRSSSNSSEELKNACSELK